MITYRGEPQKTVCPYCATVVKNFDNNFIIVLITELFKLIASLITVLFELIAWISDSISKKRK